MDEGLFGKVHGFLGRIIDNIWDGPMLHIWATKFYSLQEIWFCQHPRKRRMQWWNLAIIGSYQHCSSETFQVVHCPVHQLWELHNACCVQFSTGTSFHHSMVLCKLLPLFVFEAWHCNACISPCSWWLPWIRFWQCINEQWITRMVRKIIMNNAPTEHKGLQLCRGLPDILCSHSFADMDSEGILNVVIQIMNKYVFKFSVFDFTLIASCRKPYVWLLSVLAYLQHSTLENDFNLVQFVTSSEQWNKNLSTIEFVPKLNGQLVTTDCGPSKECFYVWKLVLINPWCKFTDLLGRHEEYSKALNSMCNWNRKWFMSWQLMKLAFGDFVVWFFRLFV